MEYRKLKFIIPPAPTSGRNGDVDDHDDDEARKAKGSFQCIDSNLIILTNFHLRDIQTQHSKFTCFTMVFRSKVEIQCRSYTSPRVRAPVPNCNLQPQLIFQ